MAGEKRKSKRYPFHALASLKAYPSQSAVQLTTLINDISYCGMGVTSYAPLHEGTRVSIQVPRILGLDVSDSIEGLVARFSRIDDFYCLGIAFDADLHPANQPLLCEALSRMTSQN